MTDFSAYEAQTRGTKYWIAARTLVEAATALFACWEREGYVEEAENVSIERMSSARVCKMRVREDGNDHTTPMVKILLQAEAPEVFACSEWP